MTFEVWHADAPTWQDNTAVTLAAFPAGFTHVANVDTEAVGAVFQLTNHITHNWTENRGVTPVIGPHVRSTSVGDIIVEATAIGADAAGRPVWRRWSVEGIGLRAF
jgi:hypothetical protein